MNDASSSPPSAPRARPHARALVLVTKLGMFALILVFVAKVADSEELWANAREIDPGMLLAFLLLSGIHRAIAAAKWLMISRRNFSLEKLSWALKFRILLVGEFVNNVVPSFVGGEAVRAWMLTTASGDLPRSTASMIVDRFVGLGGLVVWCIVLAPALLVRVPLELEGSARLVVLVVAGVLALVGGALALRRLEAVRTRMRAVAEMIDRPRALWWALALSVVNIVPIVLAFWCLFASLAPVDLVDAALITSWSRLGWMIPISTLGIGGMEGGIFLLGVARGLPHEALIVIVAMSVLAKYLFGGIGIAWQGLVHGGALVRRILGGDPSLTGVGAARAVDAPSAAEAEAVSPDPDSAPR